MEQFISKAAVIAEIKKLKAKWDNPLCMATCNAIKENINTLEVKEVNEELASEFDRCGLTWQDIKDIAEIGNDFMNSEESDDLNEEEYYTEILKRFIEKKGNEA